jgi:guanine deaminase
MRSIVTGGLVLEHGATEPRVADIVIEGDIIAAIVPPGTAEGAVIDASSRLIVPGLVNGHTHGHGGLAKGLVNTVSLDLLLNAGGWMQGKRTEEDRYLSTLVTAMEMVSKGCTACYDLAAFLPVPTEAGLHQVAQAYTDIGMRAVIAPMIADQSFYQAIPGLLDAFPPELRALAETMRTATAEDILAPIRAAARAWNYPTDSIRLGIAPTIPLHATEAFLAGCRDIANDFGLPLQTHLAESPVQRTAALEKFGMTMTAYLDKMGVLGPRFSGAHAIWIDDSEMALIAKAGGSLSHNPGSNMRLGNGIADMRRAMAAGVTVGVGTDGSSSSDNQNMFEAMRLAAFASRLWGRPVADWIGSAEALRMATEGSAAVLGMSDIIGKLAPGYKADLVFLDLDHVNLVPLNDARNYLVNGEDGAAVRDVMIGGRYVMKDRAFPGIDWPAIAAKARAAADRINAGAAPMKEAAARLAPVIDHFCSGLGCKAAHGLPRRLVAEAVWT